MLKRYFRIQYVSDLHLECYDKAVFPLLVKPVARYLALAGDIGIPGHPVYESFLRYASQHWDQVFYVAGTHEYRNKHLFHETHKKILDSTKKYTNIHYLHFGKMSYTLAKDNVAIIGHTLWSPIPNGISYKNIYVDNEDEKKPLECTLVNGMYAMSKRMIKDHIVYHNSQKTHVCVLTHHAPSYRLISSRFLNNPRNYTYAGPCDDILSRPIKAWIYGRTHNVSTGMIGSTYTAVNARGYPNEYVPGFSTQAFVEFPLDETDDPVADPELVAAALGVKPPTYSLS